MKTHFIGIFGAFILSLITALVLILVIGMQVTFLYYVIVGISGIIGFTLFEQIYTRRKK